MERDPYEVLGVGRNATDGEIKSAYRKLTKLYHPDLHPNDPRAQDKMSEINAAYDKIKDAEARYKYNSFGQSPYGQQNQGYGQSPFGQQPYGQQGYYGNNNNQRRTVFYGPFGFGVYDDDRYDSEEYQRQQNQQYSNQGSGCLGFALKIFLVIIIIRIILAFTVYSGPFVFGTTDGDASKEANSNVTYTQNVSESKSYQESKNNGIIIDNHIFNVGEYTNEKILE